MSFLHGLLLAVAAVSPSPSSSPSPSPSPTPHALHVIGTVTVASKTRRQLNTLPVQADLISSRDIVTTPGRDVESALGAIPGYAQSGTSAWYLGPHNSYSDMRGLGAGSVLVLFDGMPLNDPLGSWITWSRVPKLLVGSIEAAHGGASSLYGSAAIGGTVAIESVQPQQDAAAFDVADGNMGTTTDALALTKTLGGGWGMSAYAGQTYSKGYIAGYGPQTVDPNEPFSSYWNSQVYASVSHVSPDHAEFVAGAMDDTDHREGDFSGPTYYYGRDAFARYRHRTKSTDIEAVTYIASDGYQFDRYAAYGGPYALTGYGIMTLDTIGTLISATKTYGHVDVTLGSDFRNVAGIRDEPRFTSPTTQMSGIQAFFGSYVQGDATYGKFEAIAGARDDVYSQRQAYFAELAPSPGTTPLPATANQHISPRVALRYSLLPSLNWRASYSNAFKAPDWGALYSNYPLGGGAEFVGNPYLKAETVDSVETGLEWTPGASTRIYATLYHNSTYGRIVAAMIGPNTYSNVNVGQADAAGYELSVQRLLDAHVMLRGSFANSPTRIVEGTNASDVGNVIPQQPASVGMLALRYFNDGGAAEVQIRSIGHAYYDEANTQPIDGTTLFDGSLSERVGAAGELYMEVQNIFNRQWFAEPTTYAPPRSIMFGFRRPMQ